MPTSASGKYLFDSLFTGTYKVQFVLPTGRIFTKPTTGLTATDSDAGVNGLSGVIPIDGSLASGTIGRDNLTIDAGVQCPKIITPSSTISLCLGSIGSNITVNTDINGANSIKFVKFTSDQIASNASPTSTELAAVYAGTNVLATVTPTGASNPYTATYIWNSADFATAGTYYVYGILTNDASGGCRPVQEIKVVVNALPTFILESTSITCNGANNGTITIKNVVGASPFQYSINDGVSFDAPIPAATKTYNGLTPTTYKPAVKDANGCVKKCQ